MPSQFEPCGLNQMYSLAYGTVPIVRAVGGLKDTVVDLDTGHGATGFVFDEPTPRALLACIRRALLFYYEWPTQFKDMQERGMRTRFTWEAAAKTIYVYILRCFKRRHWLRPTWVGIFNSLAFFLYNYAPLLM